MTLLGHLIGIAVEKPPTKSSAELKAQTHRDSKDASGLSVRLPTNRNKVSVSGTMKENLPGA